MRKRLLLACVAMLCAMSSHAQYSWQLMNKGDEKVKAQPFSNIQYKAELQGSFSTEKTPLWLNANRYGLSSLEKNNGYLRGAIERPLSTDSARRWGIGYGVDLAVASHYTSKVVLQQAYFEARWLHGVLTIGEKEYPLQLKNSRLSSGSQAEGISARPVPQVRLALPEYWTIPILGRWFHFKGHVAFGMFTDGDWQEDFTGQRGSYTKKTLYHSKAGYLMIGKPEAFYPVSFEIGLEMAAQFGGTEYIPSADGKLHTYKGGHGIKDFWNAFIPGGYDSTDGSYHNVEGNQLGSWVARLNYETDSWRASLYYDHYFEDHSMMFLLDYDGYETGPDFMEKKHHRYLLYPPKDMLLGGELNLKNGKWLRDIVVEYLYTKYQSGPIYHDRTSTIADHIGGTDDYYNHSNYQSWQHWGQVMGNPLYRSPIYNSDGKIRVEDNRFVAWHLGFDGRPTENLDYRVLASWQRGYGSYKDSYTRARHNGSFMVEATYHFPRQWAVRGAYGMDFGSILGHNRGFQLTVIKTGKIK